MFNHERIVGFEYTRNGNGWHLSRPTVDAEIMAILGSEVFLESFPIKSDWLPPQHAHLKWLDDILATHGLEGSITAIAQEDLFRVEITLRPRHKKLEDKIKSP